MTRAVSALASGLLVMALFGCESLPKGSWTGGVDQTDAITSTIQDPNDVKYYRSDEPLRLGTEYFNRGSYGTAERYFRDAVEKSPEDVTAWVGLAASYDRIGRFDLADKAYHAAIKLGGETPQLLNNIGYSYMLRGDLTSARAKFNQALNQDPQNPTILNNIELLNASYRFIQRQSQLAD
jgi:Flp pilus assembly protein TadD